MEIERSRLATNSRDFGTGSAAHANPAQMAEVDPVAQMTQKKFQRGSAKTQRDSCEARPRAAQNFEHV